MTAAASIPEQRAQSARIQPATDAISKAMEYAPRDRSGGQLGAPTFVSSTAAEGAVNSAVRRAAAQDAADLSIGGEGAAAQSMTARGYFDLEEPGREASDMPPADVAAGTLSEEEAPVDTTFPRAGLSGAANLASAQHEVAAQGVKGAVMVPQGDGGVGVPPQAYGGQMGPFRGYGGQMVQSQGVLAQGHGGHMVRFQGYGNAAIPAQGMGSNQVPDWTNTALPTVCSTSCPIIALSVSHRSKLHPNSVCRNVLPWEMLTVLCGTNVQCVANVAYTPLIYIYSF